MKVPFNDLKRVATFEAAPLQAAAARVINSGWFVMGPEVIALIRALPPDAERVRTLVKTTSNLHTSTAVTRAIAELVESVPELAWENRCKKLARECVQGEKAYEDAAIELLEATAGIPAEASASLHFLRSVDAVLPVAEPANAAGATVLSMNWWLPP